MTAKKERAKVSSENIQAITRFVLRTALTAGGVVLMQDYGFSQEQLLDWQQETLKIYPDIASGQPMSAERLRQGAELLKRRITDII